jgi:hypothetical protein
MPTELRMLSEKIIIKNLNAIIFGLEFSKGLSFETFNIGLCSVLNRPFGI